MKKNFFGYAAWFGVLLIASAYALNVLSFLPAQSLPYLIANILGSLFVGIDAYRDKDYQPVALQIIWILVALIGLFQIFV